jgi:hypothetical protein
MQTVVGIFTERAAAERAAAAVAGGGVSWSRISVLSPGDAGGAMARVPTTEAEPPGIGRALGAVVGGAAGAAGGMQIGALASLFVPGVGPVIALGVVGAALLGVGGAAVGGALDGSLRQGLPRDEIYLYEDALRQGRTIVVVVADEEEHAELTRRQLAEAGAESLDAARERWWIGLRAAEAEAYEAPERFASDEARFRQGFEAALAPDCRGRPYMEVIEILQERFPETHADEVFRRGYERGRAYDSATRIARAA